MNQSLYTLSECKDVSELLAPLIQNISAGWKYCPSRFGRFAPQMTGFRGGLYSRRKRNIS